MAVQLAHTEVPSPGVDAVIGFVARFDSAGASALHTTLPFGFNPGDALTGTQGIRVWSAEVH